MAGDPDKRQTATTGSGLNPNEPPSPALSRARLLEMLGALPPGQRVTVTRTIHVSGRAEDVIANVTRMLVPTPGSFYPVPYGRVNCSHIEIDSAND